MNEALEARPSSMSARLKVAGLLVRCWHPRFVVVEKPSGLLSQPGLGMAQSDSVITRVQVESPELRLVHRLDRDTSGLLVLARDSDSLKQLSRLFEARKVHKLYAADVTGCPECGSGSVRLPLARLSTHPPRYGTHPNGRHSVTLALCAARSPNLSPCASDRSFINCGPFGRNWTADHGRSDLWLFDSGLAHDRMHLHGASSAIRLVEGASVFVRLCLGLLDSVNQASHR